MTPKADTAGANAEYEGASMHGSPGSFVGLRGPVLCQAVPLGAMHRDGVVVARDEIVRMVEVAPVSTCACLRPPLKLFSAQLELLLVVWE